MATRQTQLYLSEHLRGLLKSVAKSQRRSVSSLVEELLTDALVKRDTEFNSQKRQLEHLERIAREFR